MPTRLSIPKADWVLISREARKLDLGPIELDANPDTWSDYCHACFEGTTIPTPEGFVRWCRVRTRLDPPQRDWGLTGATGPTFQSGSANYGLSGASYGPTSPSGLYLTGPTSFSGTIDWQSVATGVVATGGFGFPSMRRVSKRKP